MTQATQRAVARQPSQRPDPQPRSWLRVVAPSSRARRAPFTILLLVVVAAGVLGLVSLSIAVNQQAFALAELERANNDLTVRHSTLRADVDRLKAPDRVERVAKQRGLQPVSRARITAWPGRSGAAVPSAGQPATPAASAGGRLWTAEDPHPLKHYLAQP